MLLSGELGTAQCQTRETRGTALCQTTLVSVNINLTIL